MMYVGSYNNILSLKNFFTFSLTFYLNLNSHWHLQKFDKLVQLFSNKYIIHTQIYVAPDDVRENKTGT